MRAPSKALCLQWVKECWDGLSTDIILKSFRVCGISVDVDSSGDSDIHCLKEGGVAAGAREDITTETASLLSGRRDSDDDADPFTVSEDEEELEANETVLEDC